MLAGGVCCDDVALTVRVETVEGDDSGDDCEECEHTDAAEGNDENSSFDIFHGVLPRVGVVGMLLFYLVV